MADSVALFAASTALQGVFRALDSGPLEAWYVDATLAAEPDAEIEKGLGAASAVLSVAIAIGALTSGGPRRAGSVPGHPEPVLPLIVALGLNVLNLVAIAVLMTETRVARGLGSSRDLGPGRAGRDR